MQEHPFRNDKAALEEAARVAREVSELAAARKRRRRVKWALVVLAAFMVAGGVAVVRLWLVAIDAYGRGVGDS